MRTHCRRGHRYTDKTVQMKKTVQKGKVYMVRNCMRCRALLTTQRYRCDEAFRENHKARERDRNRRIAAERRLQHDTIRAI